MTFYLPCAKRYHFSLLCIFFPRKYEKDLGLLSAAADKDSTQSSPLWFNVAREQLGTMLFPSIAH